MPKINQPAPIVRPGGPGGVAHPLYGVVIRDQVATLRAEVQVTIDHLQSNIDAGKKDATVIGNDGVLEGSELTKAKKARDALQKAVDHLKPVFEGLGPENVPAQGQVLAGMGRAPGGGFANPMYGVVLRNDLSKFKDEIDGNLADISASINSGELSGDAKEEADKAVRNLKSALTALGNVNAW